MFRPSAYFLFGDMASPARWWCPWSLTTVLPFKSVTALTPDAFGTISLVPATNISGENATRLPRSALAVVEPHSRSILFETTASMRSSDVTLT